MWKELLLSEIKDGCIEICTVQSSSYDFIIKLSSDSWEGGVLVCILWLNEDSSLHLHCGSAHGCHLLKSLYRLRLSKWLRISTREYTQHKFLLSCSSSIVLSWRCKSHYGWYQQCLICKIGVCELLSDCKHLSNCDWSLFLQWQQTVFDRF